MKKIAVIFGGQSSEHEVSCISAASIIKTIDASEYEVVMIGITLDGRWLLVPDMETLENGSWKEGKVSAVVSPDAKDHGLIITDGDKVTKEYIDVIFPVLHGLYGEDGTIQGLFEMSHIPYVGCGVLASACSMDKFYTKIIVNTLGIRQAKFVGIYKDQLDDMDDCITRVESEIQYPVFVKPSCAGSSKGVSKAHDRAELVEALKVAAEHDRKILVEETIVGREIECGILGGKASGLGEVLAADEFYSFDAKYNNDESRTVLDPEMPAEKVEEIRRDAEAIFKALDGEGLSRVDFFLEKGTNSVVFNEINTLPGHTAISMYPMLFSRAGITREDQVKKLIELAYNRFR